MLFCRRTGSRLGPMKLFQRWRERMQKQADERRAIALAEFDHRATTVIRIALAVAAGIGTMAKELEKLRS